LSDTFDIFAEIRNPANQLPIVDIEEEYFTYRQQILSAELKAYKRIPLLDHSINAPGDPLSWWSVKTQQFPFLSSIAKEVLGIPATSAASERVFSSAGLVVSDLRSSMKSETVRDLVLLRGSWEAIENWKQNVNDSQKTTKKRKSSSISEE
jgi:hypothetical protein